MTENAEVGFWQAVVDDQRVANERLAEHLTEARTEIARLREIVAAAALFLHHADNDGHELDRTVAFDHLRRLVNEYHLTKTP